MIISLVLLILIVLFLGVFAFLHQSRFGKNPEGARLERISQSGNYVDGKFMNQLETPLFTSDDSVIAVLLKGLVTSKERLVPKGVLPSVKTDLHALDEKKDIVVWLGHSSYYVQLAGKRILIDPVLSSYASPFFLFNRAFAGTTLYRPSDIPDIDYLLITHDHWDHLDYDTVKALKLRVKKVVTGLGVGSHMEYWGYPESAVQEADWNTELRQVDGLDIHVLPARHFSGRSVTRDKTLWVSFALEAGGKRLFFSGDSGYGPHFAEIGKQFGSFDLAVLEDGQYDKRWARIHMMPEETAQAAVDLGTKAVLPAHSGKFAIAHHAWDEPFVRLAEASRGKAYRLLTPEIGEPVDLDEKEQLFPYWWEDPSINRDRKN